MTTLLLHVLTGLHLRRAKPKVGRPPPFSPFYEPLQERRCPKDSHTDSLVSDDINT